MTIAASTIVARIAGLALLLLAAGCGTSPERMDELADEQGHGPGWTIRHDPNGRGYWAGPEGGELKYYPSSHSYPAQPPHQ